MAQTARRKIYDSIKRVALKKPRQKEFLVYSRDKAPTGTASGIDFQLT